MDKRKNDERSKPTEETSTLQKVSVAVTVFLLVFMPMYMCYKSSVDWQDRRREREENQIRALCVQSQSTECLYALQAYHGDSARALAIMNEVRED